MDVRVVQGSVTEVATEALCLGVFRGVRELGGAARAVDQALDGLLLSLLRDGDFRGERGETLWVPTQGRLPAKRVLLVGLGEREAFNADGVREAMAAAARAAERWGELVTVAHGAGVGGLEPHVAAQALVEGAVLGTYRFERHRRQSRQGSGLKGLTIVEADGTKIPELEAGARTGHVLAEAACFARDLANEPGNALPPRALAERARQLADERGLRCTVLDERALEAEKLNGILGVARGSEEPPRLIVLEHAPEGRESEPPYVLVGKGVTFDSGGISLKAREGMDAMKYDMAGAAAVLGALRAVAALGLPVRVVGLVPAVENLPSGRALKPGDVLPLAGGAKSVEITNTDAEGRLILADALHYAKRFRPRAVVDLATLTGACVVALGKEAAGLFGNDPGLLSRLKRAAERSGERVWELPLFDEYKALLKSEVADLKNSVLGRGGGLPQAGAIAGAMFLREFVGSEYPWAHLDIAGTAYDVETRLYCPKGATGYGVRLLAEWLLDVSASAGSSPRAERPRPETGR